MEKVAPGVYVHQSDAEVFPTVTAVILTDWRAFVVDTLSRPQDMEPVVEFLKAEAGDRRIVVINTHHHWDHVYGNAAFPDADIVAQRACPRLMHAQMTSGAETVRMAPHEGVPMPNITFGDRLTYNDDGGTVHLIHTPGHSEDSLVVYLPDTGVLLGGDTVEWPLPNFSQRDGKDDWVRTLRQLKQLPLELVVPSHGPAMGKTVIDANERYIAGVYDAVARAKAEGVGRGDLEVPAAPLLDAGVELDDFYRTAHVENVLWAFDEL